MAMRGTANWKLADLILKGRLEQRLRELRAERQGYEGIARVLFAESNGQITVSSGTVRRWVESLNGSADDDRESA